MPLRGTHSGLTKLMDVIAPDRYVIEDEGLQAADWLLAAGDDTFGSRLGMDTRLQRLSPQPWRVGQALGSGPIGTPCRSDVTSNCVGNVVVRIQSDESLKAMLEPHVDAIARLFSPANARMRFVFTDHQPNPIINSQALLDEFVLGPGGSKALGEWTLPISKNPTVQVSEISKLDHMVLDKNLVLE